MSGSTEIKEGDLVRRTNNCPACKLPSHQAGWVGRVAHRGQFGAILGFEDGGRGYALFYEKVDLSDAQELKHSNDLSDAPEREDERIQAWYRVVNHPILKNCYGTGGPFIDAVIARLDELSDMEMTINELKSSDEDVTEAPRYVDPGVRLRVLELALAYGDDGIGPEEMVEAAETFAAWVEGR